MPENKSPTNEDYEVKEEPVEVLLSLSDKKKDEIEDWRCICCLLKDSTNA